MKITVQQDHDFRDAWPWLDLQAQYARMNAWCVANPKRQPKNHGRFAFNWLSKERREAPSQMEIEETGGGLTEESKKTLEKYGVSY